ncbi:unnamed protein product [Lymnaea stagnalis]|uniref:G-protein coupled receptors family 1 profile domain-containing protein n=1 Tax=Lymnaea stagnalis TaxID=6523 RepID=A0AAV2H850_LYMST
MVNHVALSSAIGLFGIGANIFNMCVFLKQGLTNSMNISFFAIAISDLCAMLNPYIDRVDSPLEFDEMQYLTAGWPNGTAARITCWVTAYITDERCLSIALSLKVKRLVTTPRTSFIIFLIYLINILSLVPEYASVYFGWNFYPSRNRSLLGLAWLSEVTDRQLKAWSLISTLPWLF